MFIINSIEQVQKVKSSLNAFWNTWLRTKNSHEHLLLIFAYFAFFWRVRVVNVCQQGNRSRFQAFKSKPSIFVIGHFKVFYRGSLAHTVGAYPIFRPAWVGVLPLRLGWDSFPSQEIEVIHESRFYSENFFSTKLGAFARYRSPCKFAVCGYSKTSLGSHFAFRCKSNSQRALFFFFTSD